MSGYLEVKYPIKSNLGLNPFKSWKRQWCILRPSPTSSGGSLAVYCSEAGTVAGSVELPSGSIVRRAKSRSRPYAFAVFPADDRKPRVLLAANSLHESQLWMEKIRSLLNGDTQLGTETLLKDSYSVSIIPTDLASKCGLSGDGLLTISSHGLTFVRAQKLGTVVEWKHITDVCLCSEDRNRICVFVVHGDHPQGGGELRFATPLAGELCAAGTQRRAVPPRGQLSKSDGDLRAATRPHSEFRRSSWYSGPSDVSLDDIDLIMSKESACVGSARLSRHGRAPHLPTALRPRLHTCSALPTRGHNDSFSDRRSLLSVASGIYEEIPDLPDSASAASPNKSQPAAETNDLYCKMAREDKVTLVARAGAEEPAYECVAELAAAARRPPPLPPRAAHIPAIKLWGEAGGGDSVGGGGAVSGGAGGVTRHVSLGALHHKPGPFSVFRKRLKSDSRIIGSPKSDTAKENKDVETKKKKFDFTPTRDIFKNFRVSRKMKNLKITSGLGKVETKSCEFLDETEHVTTNRCSKSVECLEDNEFIDEIDLSIDFNDDAVAALALPQEILDLILRGREQLNKFSLKDNEVESDYMPMSPIVPPTPIEHHYIVMSPKTNIA